MSRLEPTATQREPAPHDTLANSELLEQLARDAWAETARSVIASLSRRSGDLGKAARAISSSIDLTKLPFGVAALAKALAERAPEPVRATLIEAVDWELHTFRAGRKVEASHRLEQIELGAIQSITSNATAQPGFDAEILAIDPHAPHSMGDLSRYATAYFGATFLGDAIRNAREIEVHNGALGETLGSLQSRGAKSFHALCTPRLHFHIVLTESLRYAICCDDGPDMFRHLQKVLRVAGVDSSRVTRFDHRPQELAYRASRFRECFESSGPIPQQVTIGFKNALLGELAKRAQLVAAARATPTLANFDARELLHSSERRAWLASQKLELPRVAVKLDVVDGPDDFLDHSRLAYRDAGGARREVLLVRNPYGEAAIAMGALFRECGVRDVLIYGTAASLDRTASVGALHLASIATGPDGRAHAFENRALDPQFAALHADAHVRSRVVNVRSPIDEFDRDVDRLRAEGHDLIEMELSGLLRGLHGGATRICAIHVVSDVPQSADTLEGFSPLRAQRALELAVDIWVRSFGIAEL